MVFNFIENPGCYNRTCGRFWIFKSNMIIFSSIHTFLHECVRIIQRLYNHLLQNYLSFVIKLYIIVQFYDTGFVTDISFIVQFVVCPPISLSQIIIPNHCPKSHTISLSQITYNFFIPNHYWKHDVRYVLYIHKYQGEFANLFSRISSKHLKSKVWGYFWPSSVVSSKHLTRNTFCRLLIPHLRCVCILFNNVTQPLQICRKHHFPFQKTNKHIIHLCL